MVGVVWAVIFRFLFFNFIDCSPWPIPDALGVGHGLVVSSRKMQTAVAWL